MTKAPEALPPSQARAIAGGTPPRLILQETPQTRDRRRAHDRLRRHLRSVQDAYNGVQSTFVEERIPSIFPLSVFGYSAEATGLGVFGSSVTLSWSMVPMPYAHDAEADLGVSETACASILNDLRQGMFWIIDGASIGIPPVTGLTLKEAVRVRSEYWFNYEAEEPSDLSELSLSIFVSLSRGQRRVALRAPLDVLTHPESVTGER